MKICSIYQHEQVGGFTFIPKPFENFDVVHIYLNKVPISIIKADSELCIFSWITVVTLRSSPACIILKSRRFAAIALQGPKNPLYTFNTKKSNSCQIKLDVISFQNTNHVSIRISEVHLTLRQFLCPPRQLLFLPFCEIFWIEFPWYSVSIITQNSTIAWFNLIHIQILFSFRMLLL